MNSRDSAALDRYITGNYGEDSVDHAMESLLESCELKTCIKCKRDFYSEDGEQWFIDDDSLSCEFDYDAYDEETGRPNGTHHLTGNKIEGTEILSNEDLLCGDCHHDDNG